MEQLVKLKEYYNYMMLNENDSMPMIKRQYKNMIILWHPDKHHNDENKRAECEEVTKRLNEAYNAIESFHNVNGKPKFANANQINDITRNKSFCYGPPNNDPIQFSYNTDAGVAFNLAHAAISGVSHVAMKACDMIDKYLEKSFRKQWNETDEVIKGMAHARNTVFINGHSYPRKIDFSGGKIKKGSFIGRLFSAKQNYGDVKSLLDHINKEEFCGLSKWRLPELRHIHILLSMARHCGYNVPISPEYSYVVYAYEKQPNNGKSFKQFLVDIGFIGVGVDVIWCDKAFSESIYDLDTGIVYTYDAGGTNEYCYHSSKVESKAYLWPVCIGKEDLVPLQLTH